VQELLTALIKAKGGFQAIPKDKTNPQFKSAGYSSLDAVLAAVEPSLLANDLTIIHHAAEGQYITTLYHKSGESLSSSLPLPSFADPQKMGSYLTYCRRYAITGLLGVCSDEDDDGNASSQPPQARAKALPTTRPAGMPALAHSGASADPDAAIKAELYQQIQGYFKDLDWSPERVKRFVANEFGGKPSAQWTVPNHQEAVDKLAALFEEYGAAR
jgi:hypothetical protein